MTLQIAKYEAETRAMRREVHELKTKVNWGSRAYIEIHRGGGNFMEW